jgi:hypothetical protein
MRTKKQWLVERRRKPGHRYDVPAHGISPFSHMALKWSKGGTDSIAVCALKMGHLSAIRSFYFRLCLIFANQTNI